MQDAKALHTGFPPKNKHFAFDAAGKTFISAGGECKFERLHSNMERFQSGYG